MFLLTTVLTTLYGLLNIALSWFQIVIIVSRNCIIIFFIWNRQITLCIICIYLLETYVFSTMCLSTANWVRLFTRPPRYNINALITCLRRLNYRETLTIPKKLKNELLSLNDLYTHIRHIPRTELPILYFKSLIIHRCLPVSSIISLSIGYPSNYCEEPTALFWTTNCRNYASVPDRSSLGWFLDEASRVKIVFYTERAAGFCLF